MKNKLITSLIFILLIGLVPVFDVQADTTNLLRIVSLRVSPSDDMAIIYWKTNYPTTGYVQFGLSNGFGNWVEDNLRETNHETTLAGLKPESKYYFRLEAKALDNHSVFSDTYEFETLDEDDHKAPIVSDVHTSFITGNTATFVWETNESSNSCVRYGTSYDELKKRKCDGKRVTIHDITVDKLKRNILYYYQVSSKDRAGNEQFAITRNFKTNFENDKDIPELIIYEISPFNRRAGNLNEVDIDFRTNRPVEGYIKYGDKPSSYNKRVYLPAPRDTYVKITLSELNDNQIYYYRLYLKDILKKKLDTPEFSFTTLPANVLTVPGEEKLPTEEIFNVFDLGQDYDRDGLTNAQEEEYSTDPINPDSDGDGYIDGIEIAHGYNPLGPGRFVLANSPILAPGEEPFAYNKARLKSLEQEKNNALELRQQLERYYNGRIPGNTLHWHTLVNAYIYGGYPLNSIIQAIKFSGKTVHPDIPWSAWKNSEDYLDYINR